MKLLEGKTAIITGGSRGIGKGIVETFAKHGANIAFTYNSSAEAAEAIAAEASKEGVKVKAYKSNAANFEEAQELAAQVVEEFGSIDILINNAGIIRDRSFLKMSELEWNSVIEVNLKGAFNTCKAIVPIMKEANYGRIINTTSAASFGNYGQTNYSAAKAGIVGFSKALAQEGFKHDVRTNILAPMARTRMTEDLMGPMAKDLHPELVTPVVAYCASKDCSVNGEIFSAGGGRIARIFWGVTPGIKKADITPEDMRDHLEEIMDPEKYVIASSPADEMALMGIVKEI